MPFTKGHIGFNKGLKLKGEYRNCLRCNKEVWFVESRIIKGGGKYCSRNCSNKSTALKGEESFNWKEKVGYHAVHDWLNLNFGKADKCENISCKNISKKFEWSKLKGELYERKRENFWQLCKSCHTYYDYSDYQREMLSKRVVSKYTRLKISKSLKNYFNKKNI